MSGFVLVTPKSHNSYTHVAITGKRSGVKRALCNRSLYPDWTVGTITHPPTCDVCRAEHRRLVNLDHHKSLEALVEDLS